MNLTSDPAVFLTHLRAGDVLVFDSLSAVSGLIQWADDAPANHAALMVDETTAIEANLAPEPTPAVHRVGAEELTSLARVRGVLALRHPQLTPGSEALTRVLARAAQFERDASRFSVAELMLLGPSALIRSYDRPGRNPLPDNMARRMLMVALQLAARESLRRLPDSAVSLVCSELVYRCFSDASVVLEVSDPLGPTGPAGHSVDWDDDVLAAEDDMWEYLRRRNSSVAGQVEDVTPHRDGVQADRVTPGDLWRCGSLVPVAQLAKPRPDPDPAPGGPA